MSCCLYFERDISTLMAICLNLAEKFTPKRVSVFFFIDSNHYFATVFKLQTRIATANK